MNRLLSALGLLLLSLTLGIHVFAAERQEFDRILHLNMEDLTAEASDLLEAKYPAEDWKAFRFPGFVYTSEAVETGYRIAVKEPELLRKIPCYCLCDTMGHKSLLDCFFKAGKVGGGYDIHAAGCDICYGQAMLAFLWKNAGASDEEIAKGMEQKFEWLMKQRR